MHYLLRIFFEFWLRFRIRYVLRQLFLCWKVNLANGQCCSCYNCGPLLICPTFFGNLNFLFNLGFWGASFTGRVCRRGALPLRRDGWFLVFLFLVWSWFWTSARRVFGTQSPARVTLHLDLGLFVCDRFNLFVNIFFFRRLWIAGFGFILQENRIPGPGRLVVVSRVIPNLAVNLMSVFGELTSPNTIQ